MTSAGEDSRFTFTTHSRAGYEREYGHVTRKYRRGPVPCEYVAKREPKQIDRSSKDTRPRLACKRLDGDLERALTGRTSASREPNELISDVMA